MRYLWLIFYYMLCVNLNAQITQEAIEKCYKTNDTVGFRKLLDGWRNEVKVTPTEELNDTLYRIRQLYHEFRNHEQYEKGKYFLSQFRLPLVWVYNYPYSIKDSTVLWDSIDACTAPLPFNIDYLFELKRFTGEAPTEKYQGTYYIQNPIRVPSKETISQETDEYKRRMDFIYKPMHRQPMSRMHAVYFTANMRNALIHCQTNEKAHILYYIYKKGKWIISPRKRFKCNKYHPTVCKENIKRGYIKN